MATLKDKNGTNVPLEKSAFSSAVQTSLEKAENAIQEPSNEGTDGQVLSTDGKGGRIWKSLSAGNLPYENTTLWDDQAKDLPYSSILAANASASIESDGVRITTATGLSADAWTAIGVKAASAFVYGHEYFISISLELISDSYAPTSGSTQGNMSYSTLDFRNNYNTNTIVSKSTTVLNSIVTKGNTANLRFLVTMLDSAGSYTSPSQIRLQMGKYGSDNSAEWKVKAVCIVDLTAIGQKDSNAETLFAQYGYNHDIVTEILYKITVSKAKEAENASGSSETSAIEIWGDSLVAQGYGSYIAEELDRVVVTKGYGGKTSTYIRDQFLANADLTKSIIINVGRNNYTDPQGVLNDIREMVAVIPHSRFLICTPPNGNYGEGKETTAYTYFTKIRDVILRRYPANSLDTRGATIEDYDMYCRLTQSFIQPAIGGQVTIYVSDAEFLTTYNSNDVSKWGESTMHRIVIGLNMDSVDIYKVVSVDTDANAIVAELETNNSGNGEGATISDPADTGTSDSLRHLMVMQYGDYYCYQIDTTQSTFRQDGIHMSTKGQKCLAKVITRKINQMNF